MPTYTYRCSNCGHYFDQYQRFDEADPGTCPSCGEPGRLQRVYKPVGVVFKGSGFYATDNKSRSSTSINGSASSNGSAPAEDKGAGTSEEKPKTTDTGSTQEKPSSESKPDPKPGA